jgi:hypothetical protein
MVAGAEIGRPDPKVYIISLSGSWPGQTSAVTIKSDVGGMVVQHGTCGIQSYRIPVSPSSR